jgi:hypothetical protein
LYIYDKIAWEVYPVVHFDFSKMGFSSIGLRESIEIRLLEIAKDYEVDLKRKGIGLQFAELMQKLHAKMGKQVVILIDEYDKPITDVLEVGSNDKATEHRNILRELYSVVKGNSEHIRFFFLTGIARFSKVSIFSDLNNLTDLSMDKYFHNLLGYTQQELEFYFKEYLIFISNEMGFTVKELLIQIQYWYNGYSWNGKNRLYNPYSVLRFFASEEFQNFWFESGTPKFLVELLKGKMVYDVSGTVISPISAENFDVSKLDLITLFFQTGYLTIKEIDEFGFYVLDYPNKEVEQSMLHYILTAFSEQRDGSGIAVALVRAVKKNDMEALIEAINTLFAAIPYQIFDQYQEKYFHAILFLALKLCGFFIQSEVSVSTGRIDALMLVDNRIYIFEFKLNENKDKAMKQIHKNKYYNAYKNTEKSIYLLGINFSSKTKSVENFSVEEL